MSTKILFEKNGVSREVKVGFSWTVLFFGGFAMLFRREIWEAIVYFAAITFTMGLIAIIWPWFSNKYTARKLAADGWKPTAILPGGIRDMNMIDALTVSKWGIRANIPQTNQYAGGILA